MGNKLKLLIVYELLKKTDIDHPITVKQMILQLASLGIDAERKSILRDITTLRDFGIDIQQCIDNKKGMYVQNPIFSDWELKFLVDVIDQSKIISEYSATKFYKTIQTMATINQQQLLSMTRILLPKPVNNLILEETVSIIQTAIRQRKKVIFHYIDKNGLDINKGESFIVNAFRTVFRYEEYYLIGNEELTHNLVFYKVKYIRDIRMLDQASGLLTAIFPINAELELVRYIEKAIYGYYGEVITIVVKTHQNNLDCIVHSFGEQAVSEQIDEENLKVYIKTLNSDGLYIWLLQHLSIIKVISPPMVVQRIIHLLECALTEYTKIQKKT